MEKRKEKLGNRQEFKLVFFSHTSVLSNVASTKVEEAFNMIVDGAESERLRTILKL
jgi:hypothetical protein